MTGLTPERLASIRERVEAKEWDYLDQAEADRGDLFDEVERLRAGINAIRNGCDTLLNPTEGEDR